MYAKLVSRNIKRSAKDYLIYLVTLTLCVGLFYAFLSISSYYYQVNIPIQFSLEQLKNNMKYPVLFITLVLLFLIKYVNNYMIRRKQKEFAIQTTLGMEQKTTAYLFFLETLAIGILSIAFGIILGVVLSQFMTSIIMNSFETEYKLIFTLYPDTVLITFVFFLFTFCIIGFFNIRTIRKIKVIDMLRADKQLESDFKKDKMMPFLIILATFISAFMVHRGITLLEYYDHRLEFWVKVTFFGNIIAPSLFVIWSVVYGILRLFKKGKSQYLIFIIGSIFLSLAITFFAAGTLGNRLNFSNDIKNSYILFASVFILFFIFGLFYCVSYGLTMFKEKSNRIKYKGENLFLLGQIGAKLKTNSKTMAVIACTLMFSFLALVLGPIMSDWALGYLDTRAVLDVQIFTEYNDIETIENLPKTDYGFVEELLKQKGYPFKDSVKVETYFLDKDDFKRRIKTDFPVLGISLIDYNHLRSMIGEKPICLEANTFATQWQAIATEDEIREFMKLHPTIQVGGEILAQSGCPPLEGNIAESLYNSYTDVIYILPDDICKNLMTANLNYYGITEEPLPFNIAAELEDYLRENMKKSDANTLNQTDIRTKTLQRNESISGALMIRLILIYLGVVLLIMCFTVLSLQQLADSSDFKYRFQVIDKLGVSKKRIDKIILKQMGIWFGLPLVVGLLCGGVIIYYFARSTSAALSAYIGMKTILHNIVVTGFILMILFTCYFFTTWILFQRNIQGD